MTLAQLTIGQHFRFTSKFRNKMVTYKKLSAEQFVATGAGFDGANLTYSVDAYAADRVKAVKPE